MMAMAVTGDHELLERITRYNEDVWPVHVVAYARDRAGGCAFDQHA